ncbi:MAG: hypothetical protein IKU30_00975 [Clostridia bacterium]|nr:hypothetical protein [Clostridia bacterium]
MPARAVYSQKQDKWIKKEYEKAYDYDVLCNKSAALMISFFRWYPDYFCDLCRSENAVYSLELPQRLMMRIDARYRNSYETGSRGLTKTYTKLLGKMVKGILWTGIIMRYCAPNYKQAAALATQAYHQIEKDYPIIASAWRLKNDRQDMFRIVTDYGSEFTMYAPRGDNCGETIAEEIGAEGAEKFDMQKYETDVLPTCRIVRQVNQKIDRTFINGQHSHISNACSKQNRAYSVHRNNVLRDMIFGEKYEGYVIDMSWITSLMGNLRDINYIKDMKSKLSSTDFLREMCARYTGTEENPLIDEATLARSQKLMAMEDKHCGDPKAIYVVSHDVSYVDSQINAKCADVVVKLTHFQNVAKRDKYRKQVVYVDAYPPPNSAYLQAQKLKDLWRRFCLNGGETTYLVVDAQAYGTEVVEELMKPTSDGTPPLCCVNHRFAELEQPRALPVIYPLKAGTRGATDEDGAMIQYAQIEFEQGNVEMLTTNVLDGIEAYKRKHGIKDDYNDRKIALPYQKSAELGQQIANLKTQVSGISLKEIRRSKGIQRDIWSALKYALRYSQILEDSLKKEKYRAKSEWAEMIAGFNGNTPVASGKRNDLLSLRRR